MRKFHQLTTLRNKIQRAKDERQQGANAKKSGEKNERRNSQQQSAFQERSGPSVGKNGGQSDDRRNSQQKSGFQERSGASAGKNGGDTIGKSGKDGGKVGGAESGKDGKKKGKKGSGKTGEGGDGNAPKLRGGPATQAPKLRGSTQSTGSAGNTDDRRERPDRSPVMRPQYPQLRAEYTHQHIRSTEGRAFRSRSAEDNLMSQRRNAGAQRTTTEEEAQTAGAPGSSQQNAATKLLVDQLLDRPDCLFNKEWRNYLLEIWRRLTNLKNTNIVLQSSCSFDQQAFDGIFLSSWCLVQKEELE